MLFTRLRVGEKGSLGPPWAEWSISATFGQRLPSPYSTLSRRYLSPNFAVVRRNSLCVRSVDGSALRVPLVSAIHSPRYNRQDAGVANITFVQADLSLMSTARQLGKELPAADVVFLSCAPARALTLLRASHTILQQRHHRAGQAHGDGGGHRD